MYRSISMFMCIFVGDLFISQYIWCQLFLHYVHCSYIFNILNIFKKYVIHIIIIGNHNYIYVIHYLPMNKI